MIGGLACRVAALFLLVCLSSGCGAAGGPASTGATPASAAPSAYPLRNLESHLASLKQSARDGRSGAKRRLAQTRADVLLLAQLVRNVELLHTLAQSYGSAVQGACTGRQGKLSEACVPTLFGRAARELRESKGDEPLAELLEAVRKGWDDRSGSYFVAVRKAWEREGNAGLAAAVLTWGLVTNVLQAAAHASTDTLLELLPQGVGLECPRALAKLSRTPLAERASMLQRHGCTAACAQVRSKLQDLPEDERAERVRAECSPASLGVRTPFGRDVVASNFAAWIVVRSVDWLVDGKNRIAASEAPLARTIHEQGLLERLDAMLSSLRIALPPPGALPGSDRTRVLPDWPSELPWGPAPVYGVVDESTLRVGAAPVVVAGRDGARVRGSAWPGKKVPADDSALRLRGERTPLTTAYERAARRGGTEQGAGAGKAVLLLADRDQAAAHVLRAAARFEREVGADVHLAMNAKRHVGVVRVPMAKLTATGSKPSAVLLHLGQGGIRLSAPSGGAAPLQVQELERLQQRLHEARQRFGGSGVLRLSVDDRVRYRRFAQVLATLLTADSPAFETIRLAPTGLQTP
jgi:hypothetical protein